MKTFLILVPFLFVSVACDKKTGKEDTGTLALENIEETENDEISVSGDENEALQSGNELNYAEFLTNALAAAKKRQAQDFVTNLRYFSVAIEQDEITPETLSGKNRTLYTKCLYEALINQIEIPDKFAKQAIEFLNYESDSHPENLFCLGRLYDYGWGVKQDYAKAADLYTKAAEKGHVRAMYNIGNMYMAGDGVQKDYAKAKYWYEKGAAKGDDASLQGIGLLYHYGHGVSKDLNKAAEWYIKAADKGNEIALRNMSSLDSEKVFNWFKKNENKNIKDIHYYLANMYQNGRGTTVNKNEAHKYFMKAAKLGSSVSQYMVGYNYDEGYGGVDIDWKKAVEWYKKAADQNNYAAISELAEFYYFGVGGLKQDISKAKELFTKAKKGNIINAETALNVIEEIKTGSYYTHNESQFGNRIYLEESDMRVFYKKMPVTMTEYGSDWTIPVHFYNNSEEGLRIFPTQFSGNRPNDYISYSNFSPSPGFSNGRGKHNVSVSIKKSWGARNIGYAYISGYFSNEELTIKVPVAVCWKPQNEY